MLLKKRVLCTVLALVLLLTGMVYSAPEVSAYQAAKPLPALTGNKAQDVVNIALSQVGYKEVNGGSVYGAWWSSVTGWGDYTYLGWCSIFANWCAYQAGAGMNISYDKNSAVPGNSLQWMQNNAYADRSFRTDPKPGDFIYFGNGNNVQHVAIVVGYDSATRMVTFVGGNQSNAVTKETTKYVSNVKWGYQYVLGIGRPNYGDGDTPVMPSCTCSEEYAGYYVCTTVNDPLNIRAEHSTYASVLGGIPSGAKVYVSKAQVTGDDVWAHVEYNGISGYASMNYLRPVEDYWVDTSRDSSGKLTGVKITVLDNGKGAVLPVTLTEKIPAAASVSQAIPIEVELPEAFRLELTVSAETADYGNVFIARHADGTEELLKNTVVDGQNLSVSVEKDVTLYLVKNSISFPDVPAGYWAEKEIGYMSAREYMLGKRDGSFGPNEAITRRMVALMLYRLAGEPVVSGTCSFSDVQQDLYYNAILWANQQGIITGYSDGTFRPTTEISRQHFALMLHRYTMAMGHLLPAVTDRELSEFSDSQQITAASKEACQWALSCGLINGRSSTVYDPLSSTTRAQMAVIFCRFLQACNQSQNLD